MRRVGLALFGLAAMGLAGCFAGSQPAKFYRLQGTADVHGVRAAAGDASTAGVIGLGPVEIPGYLDRPQIVTGGPANQLYLDEFNRWAEPLRDSITQVLAEDLASDLPADHVVAFPWNRALAPDYVVEVGIGRFHVGEDGKSELRASWQVLSRGKPVSIKQSRIVEAAGTGDYGKMVAAQNRSLAVLAGEIARAVQQSAADTKAREAGKQ
jgi:uncharacterized protein